LSQIVPAWDSLKKLSVCIYCVYVLSHLSHCPAAFLQRSCDSRAAGSAARYFSRSCTNSK